MRKKTGAIVMTAVLAALLVSCGNKDAAQNMAASEAADTAAGTDAKTAGNADAAETSPAEAVSTAMDPSAASGKSSAVIINVNSIDSVAKFLSGEWDMTDTLTGDDFGVLTFGGDGACSFKYNGSGAKMNGTVSFTKHSHYDSEKEDLVDDPEVTGFEMNFTEIPGEFALPGLNEVFPTEESVSGYFHTGCGNGEDYLYLDWIGNGDSYVFEYIFQNRDRLEKEYGKDSGHELQTRWFLHRANGGITYPETPKDSEFHAFCWRNPSGNELILEPLELHTNDEYEDYTGRHFSSGYFTPKG
ncbi:MAG: hypothetical protein K6E33_08635, partial [Lachnospiraceae bacterium]|nr:hypothetical protein [Lachnospiraceae bacterium]